MLRDSLITPVYSWLHAFTCWYAWIPLIICNLSPRMKQASLLRFPVWLTTLQSFKLDKQVWWSLGHPPRGLDLPHSSPLCCWGVPSYVYGLVLVWGHLVGHCCILSEQQSATSHLLTPQAILIFHWPTLRVEMSGSWQWLPSWQEKKGSDPHQSLTHT